MNSQSPSATVGYPMPPAANKLMTTATTPAPRAAAEIGSRRHSGAPKITPTGQLMPRISQRLGHLRFERIQLAQ